MKTLEKDQDNEINEIINETEESVKLKGLLKASFSYMEKKLLKHDEFNTKLELQDSNLDKEIAQLAIEMKNLKSENEKISN
jgi:hypothetical protein